MVQHRVREGGGNLSAKEGEENGYKRSFIG